MKRALIGFSMIVLLTAAGCTRNVVNINGDIYTGSGHKATLAEIEKAIELAGESAFWQTQPVSPGHIVATKTWGHQHMAQVDIKYTTDSYSITYKDSSDSLKYDGTQINRNYNHYVGKLRRAIHKELLLL